MGLFGKKKPEIQDEALADLAQMFYADPEDPTPGTELFDAAKMDLSVESLKHVDEYLEQMRQRGLEGEDLMKVILRGGAYVGEVIRTHHQTKTLHWIEYKDAAKLSSMIKEFGESLEAAAILWDGDGGFWFPLAKILKYLENGSEDSVYFFAHVVLEK